MSKYMCTGRNHWVFNQSVFPSVGSSFYPLEPNFFVRLWVGRPESVDNRQFIPLPPINIQQCPKCTDRVCSQTISHDPVSLLSKIATAMLLSTDLTRASHSCQTFLVLT